VLTPLPSNLPFLETQRILCDLVVTAALQVPSDGSPKPSMAWIIPTFSTSVLLLLLLTAALVIRNRWLKMRVNRLMKQVRTTAVRNTPTAAHKWTVMNPRLGTETDIHFFLINS
jgi:hypothetical protein